MIIPPSPLTYDDVLDLMLANIVIDGAFWHSDSGPIHELREIFGRVRRGVRARGRYSTVHVCGLFVCCCCSWTLKLCVLQ